MCTAVILANDMETRLQGPIRIAPFDCRDNCAPPREGPNTAANYRTFSPFAPLYEDITPARGVADLSDDNGNVLHICPLCDQDPFQPNLLANRKALLAHLRGHGNTRAIPAEIQALFGITLCTGCDVHYVTKSIKGHACRPGVARHAPVLQRYYCEKCEKCEKLKFCGNVTINLPLTPSLCASVYIFCFSL